MIPKTIIWDRINNSGEGSIAPDVDYVIECKYRSGYDKQIRVGWTTEYCAYRVRVPEGVTSLPSDAFYYTRSMKEIILPDSITSFGINAFKQSGISSLVIPPKVTRLSDYCFSQCENIKDFVVPEHITELGKGVFAYNNYIKITVLNRNCVFFYNPNNASECCIPSTCTIYGYAGSTTEEYATTNGNKFIALDEEA